MLLFFVDVSSPATRTQKASFSVRNVDRRAPRTRAEYYRGILGDDKDLMVSGPRGNAADERVDH